MTRVNTSLPGGVDYTWICKNQDEIKSHPALVVRINTQESENLLEGKEPYTYLLREDEQYVYYITYAKSDGSIKHQRFTLEPDRKGWYYRNGVTDGPAEILSESLEELIPQMMHCKPSECIPLKGNR